EVAALELRERRLVEDLRDGAHAAHDLDAAGRGPRRGDARALLPAVLEREEAVERLDRGLGIARDPEDAARVLGFRFEVEGLGLVHAGGSWAAAGGGVSAVSGMSLVSGELSRITRRVVVPEGSRATCAVGG